MQIVNNHKNNVKVDGLDGLIRTIESDWANLETNFKQFILKST